MTLITVNSERVYSAGGGGGLGILETDEDLNESLVRYVEITGQTYENAFFNLTDLNASGNCFQAEVNVSNGCGDFDNGTYQEDELDWSFWEWYNFTTPEDNLKNVTWEIGDNNLNLSIPSACYERDILALEYFFKGGLCGGTCDNFKCYNGTDYISLLSTTIENNDRKGVNWYYGEGLNVTLTFSNISSWNGTIYSVAPTQTINFADDINSLDGGTCDFFGAVQNGSGCLAPFNFTFNNGSMNYFTDLDLYPLLSGGGGGGGIVKTPKGSGSGDIIKVDRDNTVMLYHN